jgi:nitrite reductase/ring-hydroxylating ferredoxin subunit/uncharacterized membrane protein
MGRVSSSLERIVGAIEDAPVLDRVANPLANAIRRITPKGLVKDAVSGTPIGHPVHPLLVVGPLGAWTAACYLDLAGGAETRVAARRLVGFGLVAALPAAAAGASDWADTSGAERRVGLVHAALNDLALGLYLVSWRARRHGRQGTGRATALLGASVLVASGWLGGHLAYALGVGVDTTAFENLPTDWTDVASDTEIGDSPHCAMVNGVPVLLVRRDSRIVALADRCTHRGGPLHEGQFDAVAGTVVCPWHGSCFDVLTGEIRRGPATRPEPTFATRVVDGRVQLRRSEERALRTNPIGA